MDANGRIELGNGSAEESEPDESARRRAGAAPQDGAKAVASPGNGPYSDLSAPEAMGPGRSASFPGEL